MKRHTFVWPLLLLLLLPLTVWAQTAVPPPTPTAPAEQPAIPLVHTVQEGETLTYIAEQYGVTIEDPIEYLHRHEGCIVSQREVGIDTESYEVALKNTLRQAPDVILIGEIRTREVMEHALTFAETGHLVLSTLHANNANQALERILHFFPEER
ncbi:MAG TPA: LysM peptidoglycan-binding domain-containing protein, partial [Anaerolineae bacterium]|nr:LysM peptidoglycan-binding domain-containing protein [Anaerolineae bacterium]